MGFYNTIKIISQSLFFFILGEGGPPAHKQRKPILDIVSHNFLDTRYRCDNFDHFNYGNLCYVYSLSKKLRESRKDNMSIEKNREIINSITNPDSLKAVQVAFNINESQDKVISQLVNLVQTMDKNMKLLAVKVLELEKKNERSQN